MTDISVVVPAYNESKRIVPFLTELAAHCGRSPLKYEVLIVDDGSSDGTVQTVEPFVRSHGFVRVVKHPVNRGKGAAVRTGMLEARGKYRLFMDADGSFRPSEIEPSVKRLEAGNDVVIGSRFVQDGSAPSPETWHHRAMRWVLNRLSRLVLGFDVRDSQCGFKFFTGEAAQALFSVTRIDDFAFDLELLHLASRMGLRVRETRVACVAQKGSKVRILKDTLRLFVSLFQIRFGFRYGPLPQPAAHAPAD